MNATTLVKDPAHISAAKRLSRFFPGFEEDIAQEAFLVCWDTTQRKGFDASRPEAQSYLYRAAMLTVTPRCNRWVAVTHLSKEASRAGSVGMKQRNGAVGYDGFRINSQAPGKGTRLPRRHPRDHRAMPPVAPSEYSFEAVILLAQSEVSRLRTQRRRLMDALSRRDDEAGTLGALLLGMDAAPMTLAKAARRLGLELDEAKKLNTRWLKLVKSSPKIAALTAHIENIEENLP
jgi:hypothetical protein